MGPRTIGAGAMAVGELVERRSRFVAEVVHAGDVDAAEAFLADVRARSRDARHHVSAWVLANDTVRASDDGEPRHTAGRPVLDVLRGEGLVDVCCVVTRWFGGTLLGAGGLVRAYGDAARRAVASAADRGLLRELVRVVPVEARVPYALRDRALDLAWRCGGVSEGADYVAEVRLHLIFPSGAEATFMDGLRELAQGEDLCTVGEERLATL